MTRKNSNRRTSEIKAMMAEDDNFLRPIVRTVIQEFLEAEMTHALRLALLLTTSSGPQRTVCAIEHSCSCGFADA